MPNHEQILQDFLELLRITSPTFEERKLANVLRLKLESLGLIVLEDRAGQSIGGDCGNLIATLPPTLPEVPILLLSAHMDNVEPGRGVRPIAVDEAIRSSGDTVLGGDDKVGVVSILEAMRTIQERRIPHGEIQVVFTVAEEGGLLGARNIDRTLLHADFGYVLDSSSPPGKIIHKAPGENNLTIKISGRSAHAGTAPEKGLNAIILAAKALSEIPDGRINEKTTANIGTINGGLATNIVPDSVIINGGTRSQDLAELDSITKEIKQTIECIVKEHGGITEVTAQRLYDPFELSTNQPVIEIAEKAIRSLGLKPDITATGGGSDANYFNKYGIPCANLGIGTQKVHTTEEFIKVEDLYKTAEIVVEIIRNTAAKRKILKK